MCARRERNNQRMIILTMTIVYTLRAYCFSGTVLSSFHILDWIK